jgi:DNA mismatch repair protein MutS2
VDVFLDNAALNNISPIYIVHGHGTGQLRKAVRNYLKQSLYVDTYKPGEQSEGGDGVTIVEVK